MSNANNLSNISAGAGMAGTERFALDVNNNGALKRAARENSPEAIKAVAKQFEGLFLNMVMKSMRDATPKDGVFDSEQSKMFTSMLDQQVSQNLAKRSVGLADVLERQLSNNRGLGGLKDSDAAARAQAAQGGRGTSAALDAASGGEDELLQRLQQSGMLKEDDLRRLQRARSAPVAAYAPGAAGVYGNAGLAGPVAESAANVNASQPAHVQAFQARLGAHADEASRTTGIPAKFMLGQAALESGWGKREIVARDGSSSHNVFGIKATGNWKGRVVEAVTTEYVDGAPQRRLEKFRAYDSYADAFRDYASLLTNNRRYDGVIANSRDAVSFAEGLQRAGYATDPEYAAKLTRIIKQTLA
jgi:flagellar protein FlgJ